jgi:3-deoxy-D-manno-octulosonic-acid transferase
MWRYKLLLFIIFIPLTLYTLWQSLRAAELRYFLQRLAIFFNREIKPGGLWIHAASVGEVNAVIPLILKIHAENPQLAITLSSNTISSASVALKQLPDNIQHYYFPLDYRWAIKRVINKIKPKTIFIVETEFWPNLYSEAARQNIPLLIINGRISEKTLHAKQWLKNIYAQILPLVTQIYARSETDLARFITLGADPEKIEARGNIKFASSVAQNIDPVNLNRPYVLAASTREDEEQLIVDAWLKADRQNHLLVIVPRHPARLSDIIKQLTVFNINLAIRSKNEPVTESTDIYIADTIGELKQFIAGSEFAVMGGSFVPKGGHNILEVAQMGKAVIFGDSMYNFEDEAKVFVQQNIGVQSGILKLVGTFSALISNRNYRLSLEENAGDFVKNNEHILDYYYQTLKEHINSEPE